ncbi:MAG: glycoside hydrolase family 95 protein [Chloroflexota bacterium]
MNNPLSLWYHNPAPQWVEALPIGNGRLGGMVFGGISQERIQFNEDTVWTGAPHDYAHAGAAEHFPTLRQMMLDMVELERAERWDEATALQKEAEALAMQHFMSIPLGQKSYQPTGDLWINFPEHRDVEEYQRGLSLDDGVSYTSYIHDNIAFQREVFASYPDQVIVVRLWADKLNAISCNISITSPHVDASVSPIENDGLLFEGQVEPNGIRFAARLAVEVKDGSLVATADSLQISDASEVIITLTAASSFVSYQDISADARARCRLVMDAVRDKTFDQLRTRHVADHAALFNRVALTLGDRKQKEEQTQSTLERLLIDEKTDDVQLFVLYFQYGRYLLIASSRPGSQPANLQGIWNDKLEPPWDSKWTVNINTEMNYWPAELTNLSECHEPLFDLLAGVADTGKQVAHVHYGARGWVLHHNSDIWRGAAPINHANHGIWPTGGAWLSQHLWWRYEFTGDEAFLRTRAYPILREAALFFVDILTVDSATGWLISPLSNSPELGGLVAGPTMDHQIIRELFENVITASEILGVDEELRQQLSELKVQIAPNQIGQHGQLQEWLVDKDDPDETHRHVSHLWGLHPGREITEETPELFAAAQQSLRYRGDAGTGWSMGWKINFWARFKDGDHALMMLNNQLRLTGSDQTVYEGGGTYPNLFDAHPPFQIDGNFGATSGIAEMLLQSHTGMIELLPALPSKWRSGSVKGLCARGGFEIDIEWQEGRLVGAQVRARLDGECTVRYQAKSITWQAQKGGEYDFDGWLNER